MAITITPDEIGGKGCPTEPHVKRTMLFVLKRDGHTSRADAIQQFPLLQKVKLEYEDIYDRAQMPEFPMYPADACSGTVSKFFNFAIADELDQETIRLVKDSDAVYLV